MGSLATLGTTEDIQDVPPEVWARLIDLGTAQAPARGPAQRLLDPFNPPQVRGPIQAIKDAFDVHKPWGLADTINAGLMVVPGARGMRRSAAPAPASELPMDAASRMAREQAQNYAKEPFYRGEATGATPQEFPGGGFFSRDKGYAAGIARRGGQSAPAEYRLKLDNAFDFNSPVTAEQYGRLIEGLAKSDSKLAAQMVNVIAPGKDVNWFTRGFAKAKPDFVVAERGDLVHQMIERGGSDLVGTFRRAGFDAIDTGRDVQKLAGGTGIRSVNAAFDPAKASWRDIMAGVAGGVPLAGTLADYPSQR